MHAGQGQATKMPPRVTGDTGVASWRRGSGFTLDPFGEGDGGRGLQKQKKNLQRDGGGPLFDEPPEAAVRRPPFVGSLSQN